MMHTSLRMIFIVLLTACSSAAFFADFPSVSFGVQIAHAQVWKDEFDDICGKTSNSMNLSREELKGLIDRCNKLRVVIEQLEETQKKVYLKRLSLCQDLFSYVLQSKEKD